MEKEQQIFKNEPRQIYYVRCLRCGRKLKSVECQQRGYGNVCYEKIKRIKDNALFTI